MADYFTQAVFNPTITLEKVELELIRRCGAGADGPDEHGKYYVYVENGFWPFYAEGGESEELLKLAREVAASAGAGANLEEISGETMVTRMLQRALRRMPPEVKHIEGEASFTCSKMRPDGFGGAWFFITRRRIIVGGTGQELMRLAALAERGLSLNIPGRAYSYYHALAQIAKVKLPGEAGYKPLNERYAEKIVRLARSAVGLREVNRKRTRRPA